MYFDRKEFPNGSPVDWVRGRDLRDVNVFEASPHLVPNLKFARNYIRERIERETSASSLGNVQRKTGTCAIEMDSSRPDDIAPFVGYFTTGPASQENDVSFSSDRESETSQSYPSCSGKDPSPESRTASSPAKTTGCNTDPRVAERDKNQRTTTAGEMDFETNSLTPTARASLAVSAALCLEQLAEEPAADQNEASDLTQCNQPSIPLPYTNRRKFQKALSVHTTKDLLKLKTKSIGPSFPKEVSGNTTRPPQLSPVRPRTVQWYGGLLVAPDGSPHTVHMPPALSPEKSTPQSRDPESSPGQAPWPFIFVGSRVNITPTISQPAETNPSATQAATTQPRTQNTNSKKPHLGTVYKSDSGTVSLIREPRKAETSQNPQEEAPAISPPKPLPIPAGRNFLCLQTGEPRFGLPPHEVPPFFLKRLRDLAGSKDENPLVSVFLVEDHYRCPWCNRGYLRTVSFTDHLALAHLRSPDPKWFVISQAEAGTRIDLTSDKEVIDLTSG
ncbi:hypothetical protein FALBO_4579 [Fusarium albosuccineum]|uniref:C2H2-type domain-containing protein n=1 Tax=Fusarium albosuccineum TaxID=1237068 RepID=A0A8H4PAM0_9HYPO|nr:hypothetical protein FALBO_4579 [Fusarium albosuccineum]